MTFDEFKTWFYDWGPVVMIAVGYFAGFVMFSLGMAGLI